MGLPFELLDSTALDGGPAQAFASHRTRANGVAEFFAALNPLSGISGQAGDSNTLHLIAHLHVAARDPENSQSAIEGCRSALRRLDRGNGLMGTDLGPLAERDYDMGVKGLMPIAYRYGHLLRPEDRDFILDELMPANLRGGHPIQIELAFALPGGLTANETENHLLMIETSRYLVNQLLQARRREQGLPPDRELDNVRNGLSSYLLGFMQTIAQHDFLEFNSRAYARLALQALLNLHEFALERRIRDAAQILLDYTMMKFAVSSVRGRRVAPYRRVQHKINHQANIRNDLYAESGDQVAGFFLAYTGLTDTEDRPTRFPDSVAFQAVIAGTAAYRPPPAAYSISLDQRVPVATHRFHHGGRPRLRFSDEDASPGIEIYHRSPSFLLSAGGSFLNSGYGNDELDVFVQAYEQTSRAQATTLIPTRSGTRSFHDLIRFEPYPDSGIDPYADDPEDPDTFPARAVSMGVHRGIIAGANLRPAEATRVLEESTSEAPALAAHDGHVLAAWKGSGNDNLNVAPVQMTTLLGIDGVEGVNHEAKSVLAATTDLSPAIASHGGRVFIAWRGSGNDQLNLACSGDGGKTFGRTTTLSDSSEHAPALASHAGRLLLAWTGRGNDKLNVAKVVTFADTSGRCGVESLEDKVVLADTSSDGPALASNGSRLFLGWKGSDNENLNVSLSEDGGTTFRLKRTFDETSSDRPSLASHAGNVFMAWKGAGNEQLNVAHVVLLGSTAGFLGLALEDHVVLPDESEGPPALASNGVLLLIAWQHTEDENLGLRVSRDGTFRAPGPWIFPDTTGLGFHSAVYRAAVARPDDLVDPPQSLGIVHARETEGMDAETFRRLTLELNAHLPPAIEYGSFHEFHPPDGGRFLVSFQLTSQPDRPRVVDLDDPIDFTSLPLVSGRWLSAPGGHDGRIEIRHPDAEAAPVVLDFRNAESPERTDNLSQHPQPWIDRAVALFRLAGKFFEDHRTKDAQAALLDAVDVWELLAPVVDISTVAENLTRVAGLLSAVGLTSKAVDIQRRVLDLLRDSTPAPGQQVPHLLLVAEARQNLIVRLIDDHRQADAAALAGATIAAYRTYVDRADAAVDAIRLSADLTPLQKLLASAGISFAAEPLEAALLLVRAYTRATPPADHLEFDITFADARHNLVARLLDAHRIDDGATQAALAIDAYRSYAAERNADRPRAIRGLTDLATVLRRGGLNAEADSAESVAAGIGPA